MIKYACRTVFALALLVATATFIYAQEAVEPRPSPMAVALAKQGDTYVKIVYSQPHKRGREIFGSELVPYGKVWRLGANEATEITLTEGIEVGGKQLEAGTYSMYAIPQKDKWTIIFSSMLGEWGAYNYDESKDVLRVEAPVEVSETSYEPFTVKFNEEGDQLTMVWDKTKVVVPVSLKST